jgi:charged multivesicular body protein 6
MGSLLFGCPKSRTAKLDKQESAIMDCKLTRDKIKAYIRNLDRTEKIRKEKAKESLRNKNKDKAKMFLMQAKMYREQISSAQGQLNLIEEQIMQIETMRIQKEAVTVLEQGNKILDELSREVNVEKLEKIADDMNEYKQVQEEIGNFLKSHSIDQNEYEEAVDKELENLMKLENNSIEAEFPSPNEEVKKKVQNAVETENDQMLVA